MLTVDKVASDPLAKLTNIKIWLNKWIYKFRIDTLFIYFEWITLAIDFNNKKIKD